MRSLSTLAVFLLWVFGFFALLSFDLFVEAFVFEWLAWNGTTKNDWFFVLWWGLVVVWFLYGLVTLLTRYRYSREPR
jgi:hypothetical protein